MASFEYRGNSVRAVVRIPGGGKIAETFDTLAEAERWAEPLERKKKLGGMPAAKGIGSTLGTALELFLDAVAVKADSSKWNKLRIMNWLNDPLTAKPIGGIVTHDINGWIERRLATPNERTGKCPTPATVNRELNLLSSAFTYAVKSLKWITVNPCYGCQRPERSRPRKRPLLTPAEIDSLMAATGYSAECPEPRSIGAKTGACFLLSLETGMRSGELLRLRPKDYWRDKKTIHVAAIEVGGRKGSKSGQASTDPSRNVPLTDRAIELLDQLLATMPKDQKPAPGFTRPPYIVGIDDRQRDANWRKARDRSGVEELTFHDSKHEAATRLARFLDVLELSHAIGTKDVRLLRDTYYNVDASRAAARLPSSLTGSSA